MLIFAEDLLNPSLQSKANGVRSLPGTVEEELYLQSPTDNTITVSVPTGEGNKKNLMFLGL